MSISQIGAASAGMNAAMTRMAGIATKVASGDMEPAAQAVSLYEAKASVQANVAVVRAQDKMLGTLLDMLA